MTYKFAFCTACNRNTKLVKVKGGWIHKYCGKVLKNPKYKFYSNSLISVELAHNELIAKSLKPQNITLCKTAGVELADLFHSSLEASSFHFCQTVKSFCENFEMEMIKNEVRNFKY